MLQFGQTVSNHIYRDRPGVYAVIIERGMIALILWQDDYYMLPGGGIDPGENHHNALAREIIEETGYTSHIGTKLGLASQYITIPDCGLFLNKIGHYYEANLLDLVTSPSEPDHRLVCMPVTKANDLLFEEAHRWAVRRCLNLRL